METSVIETVAKYFYFFSLEDRITFSASFRVLGDLKSNGWIDTAHKDRWIHVLNKWRGRMHRIPRREWNPSEDHDGFIEPKNFNRIAWMNFLNHADHLEVEAVVLSQILNFTDEEIAKGLGVSVGTVRYRVGRGLRQLGGFLEP